MHGVNALLQGAGASVLLGERRDVESRADVLAKGGAKWCHRVFATSMDGERSAGEPRR